MWWIVAIIFIVLLYNFGWWTFLIIVAFLLLISLCVWLSETGGDPISINQESPALDSSTISESTNIIKPIDEARKTRRKPTRRKIVQNNPIYINPMNFITIDFETANEMRSSPCEIGLTFVRNGKIIDTKSWLIRPKHNRFESYNISIHGIKPKDVENEPEFHEVWKEVQPMVEGQLLIAHNAGFDMSVLRHTLELYELPLPNFNYICSCIFSRKVWLNQPCYGLEELCDLNGIKFNHHRAGDDSRATAELALKAFEITDIVTIDDITTKLLTTIGSISQSGYKPCLTKRLNKPKVIIGDPSLHNPDSIFYGSKVVFTGTLSSITRAEAKQKIANIGGLNSDTLSKNTDYLVIGMQDYRKVGQDGMSNKQKKAIKYIEEGTQIEIMSEIDFWHNV